MDKQLGTDLIHVTEMAAIAAARVMGCGDRHHADHVATEAMRLELNQIVMDGRIVIGEGERDEAPMLFVGEELGDKSGLEAPQVDIAVDPLENTNATAKGLNNAMVTLAISERGGLLHAPDVYMDKIVVGHVAAGKIDLDAAVSDNIQAIATAYNRTPAELVVAILDRQRHEEKIKQIRATGARVKLIPDGDLSEGIAAAVRGTAVHAVMGIGGAPEAVLTAAAMRCLGGEIQARFVAIGDDQVERLGKLGYTDWSKKYTTEELASGKHIIFLATAVTFGDLLKGVRFFHGGARTETLYMSTQTRKIRFIDTIHQFGETEIRFS